MPLTLSSPIVAIDRKLALRRGGSRTKGPEAHTVLEEAFDITTVGELLHHYPRRYIDRSRVETIRGLQPGESATVIATVRRVAKRQTKRHQSMVTVTLHDGTGALDLTFFNQPWAASLYREGSEVAVSGVAQLYRGRLQLANQEVEVLRGDGQDLVHTARITPVHPASEGISAKTIRELIWRALEQLPPQADPLPPDVLAAESLSDWDAACRRIHFPADEHELASARERLKFDELFMLELGVAFRRQRLATERTGVAHEPDGPLTRALKATLPFEPTRAQHEAMNVIGTKMAAPQPMNVLLQGDVGSGKTLVALHACLVAVESGHQAAIMAPTEVLAGQHARSVADLLRPMGGVADLAAHPRAASGRQRSLFEGATPAIVEPTVRFAMLTGSVTGKERERVSEGIEDGTIDLVIGTHALVQGSVTFQLSA